MTRLQAGCLQQTFDLVVGSTPSSDKAELNQSAVRALEKLVRNGTCIAIFCRVILRYGGRASSLHHQFLPTGKVCIAMPPWWSLSECQAGCRMGEMDWW